MRGMLPSRRSTPPQGSSEEVDRPQFRGYTFDVGGREISDFCHQSGNLKSLEFQSNQDEACVVILVPGGHSFLADCDALT
ncbi:hypothetical protein LPU83_pLPU83d_0322 (plasmid) [Rhizobium favelukesii]|uniref:Uncharacterized protein n=1 Tax=Rhizobium favelukesii TaxID=348824 RepID=W6RS92_9HYPH|nr:hypothetical protein LPU83_pLPU83d_0322 [Rhizobium favelukesii]